jgi:polyribonucleotide nucleotidyltransferase
MASVCGVAMALLDAGVPLLHPVAGVSVGVATTNKDGIGDRRLCLDITGTEDYYGGMDFKGTFSQMLMVRIG